MLDKSGSILQAMVKLVEVYGYEYIKLHKDAPFCYSEENGSKVISFLFESKNERPDLPSDNLGWAVYATVKVNPNTMEAVITDGIKQDGSIID